MTDEPAEGTFTIEEMSFEEAAEELESIIDRLERGDVPLEDGLDAYGRGVRSSPGAEASSTRPRPGSRRWSLRTWIARTRTRLAILLGRPRPPRWTPSCSPAHPQPVDLVPLPHGPRGGVVRLRLRGLRRRLLNVVARMPTGRSVVSPPSRCPRCGWQLTWHENLPVLGWLLLRGRCRRCRGRIGVRARSSSSSSSRSRFVSPLLRGAIPAGSRRSGAVVAAPEVRAWRRSRCS